jgi:ABC-2 type transport system permease protein
MIATIVRNGFIALRRDRGALILSFVLPVAFFTIFAFVFGQVRSGGTNPVTVIVVDQDRTAVSQRLVERLKLEKSLTIRTMPAPSQFKAQVATNPLSYNAATAKDAVHQGDAPAAIIIPKGFGANPIAFGPSKNRPIFTILHDSSDPVAAQLTAGMLQEAVLTMLPDLMAPDDTKHFDKFMGGLTLGQSSRKDSNTKARSSDTLPELVAISTHDVVGQKKSNPMISFYAAGIGVMFLLFTASGAAGTLIDEAESGALDRMLSARVGMTQILAGKAIYVWLLAFLQLVVMFLWGAVFFKLDLFSHLPGFFVMTAVTAFACASFGMLLASLSRTRAQQAAISTLLILTMSALGGSMFPRFLMPEAMRQIGNFTFNAWAIDGYTKVFWRDQPIMDLIPQVEVLVGSGLALFVIARLFARRWETA